VSRLVASGVPGLECVKVGGIEVWWRMEPAAAVRRLASGWSAAVARRTVTEPSWRGVDRQDQLERFSGKREHNQHI
jgi:hypothetical protein